MKVLKQARKLNGYNHIKKPVSLTETGFFMRPSAN
jgi:hypothetical protein